MLELHDQVDHVIYQSGLIDFFRKEKDEKGETRVENLEELVSAAKSFTPVSALLTRSAAGRGNPPAFSRISPPPRRSSLAG